RPGASAPHTIDFEAADGVPAPDLIHIAMPTTLSAGQFTPIGGVTDEKSNVKGGVVDPRLAPRTIILDPELTVETPAWLWTATGMRAMDHAVEVIYSSRHQLIADTLGARAISLLVNHLPASLKTTGAESLAHRGPCQRGAWISHALGDQIGPMWDVPHGVTSCITLPHVMRFMAGVAPERFSPIAEGLGVRFEERNARAAAMECADRMGEFVAP